MSDRPEADLDRRGFLLRSGAGLGGFLASPKLGLLAAALGVAATGSDEPADAAAAGPASCLLRAGEPINSRGQPFGHDISGLAVFEAPATTPGSRKLLVVGHDNPRPGCEERIARRTYGISVLEVGLGANRRWQHQVASECNRRWDAETPIALDGGRLDSNGVLHRLQDVGGGLSRVAAVETTPWNTALACERDGWIVEVNAMTGYAVRRASLGRLGPVAARVHAAAGGRAVVYMLTPSHVFKFVSHQRFEPRRLDAGRSILTIGELSALAFDADAAGAGQWQPVTRGLFGRDWEMLMRDPYGSDAGGSNPVRLPAPLAPEQARDAYERLHETGLDAWSSQGVILKTSVQARAAKDFLAEAGADGARLLARLPTDFDSLRSTAGSSTR